MEIKLKIEKVLNDFGISGNVVDTTTGPTVTRYELQVQSGIKIAKIISIEDNISLELACKVRVSGAIPGKSVIGIEVPNKNRKNVITSSLVLPKRVIPVVLGKDSITGEPVVDDLTKMPHLLIAGATGTGKSVCINTIIYSLIAHCSPKQLKLIMVDPKMIELSIYNGISHLLTPVVTDATNSFQLFNWILKEMERRYTLLKEIQVRDIIRYNSKSKEKLHYIVIVIDEFADLMAIAKKDIELSISRIVAMSRAVGIHLILATQRPSVDVITGVIKANFTTRIAFQVASKVDSRTILDQNGAESLIGNGDMLFQNATSLTPQRIQGALTSEEEIENIVKKNQTKKSQYIELESENILEKIVNFIISEGKVSIPSIKKELKLETDQINSLLNEMKDMHILSKDNKILVTQW